MQPRCKRMNREARLQSARRWLQKHNGKNVVKRYKTHFGVDWLCAIKELKMLGIEIDPDYEEQVRLKVENSIKQKQSGSSKEFVQAKREYRGQGNDISGYAPVRRTESTADSAPYKVSAICFAEGSFRLFFVFSVAQILMRSQKRRKLKLEEKERERENMEFYRDSDENFAYIAR
jgi:hypothetical protein